MNIQQLRYYTALRLINCRSRATGGDPGHTESMFVVVTVVVSCSQYFSSCLASLSIGIKNMPSNSCNSSSSDISNIELDLSLTCSPATSHTSHPKATELQAFPLETSLEGDAPPMEQPGMQS